MGYCCSCIPWDINLLLCAWSMLWTMGLTTGCSAFNTEKALASQATMNMPMRLVIVSARAVSLITVVVSWWRMPDGCGFGPGSIICPPPPTHPTPWPNTSGGGDSKYVSGLLKHINDQNEGTVNPFASDENSIRPANFCGNDNTVGNSWLSTNKMHKLHNFWWIWDVLVQTFWIWVARDKKRVGYGMWWATISEMWDVGTTHNHPQRVAISLSRTTATFLVMHARARNWEVSFSSGHARGLTCSQVVENKSILKESSIVSIIRLYFRWKAVFHVCHLNYKYIYTCISIYVFVEKKYSVSNCGTRLCIVLGDKFLLEE